MKPVPKLATTAKKLSRLRRLSQILDNAIPIPGTKQRIGIDPIIGMLPGGGDLVTGALGAYIILESARMGVERQIIGKMIGNILLDAIAGTVPVVGDFFDMGWKANVKNIALLEKHIQINPDSNKPNWLFLIGLTILLVAIVIGFAALTVLILRWLWQAIQ